MQGLFSRLFTSILVMSLLFPGTILLAPGHAHAFGGLSENGTAAFMGIGIAPQKILHVSGTGPGTVPLFQRASDSAGFIIERTSTNRWVLGVNESPTLGNGFVLSTIPAGTQSVPRLMVTQDGNVGIGTTSPVRKLDVNGTGRFAGTLTTCNLTYSSPRTHYYSIPGADFTPESDTVQYSKGIDDGAAYCISSASVLFAPVHLPDGATVTEFRVYFYDDSSSDVSVVLFTYGMDTGAYAPMATASSTGASSSIYPVSDTSILSATIDNRFGYVINAYWQTADSTDLKVMGALITYTISEAE